MSSSSAFMSAVLANLYESTEKGDELFEEQRANGLMASKENVGKIVVGFCRKDMMSINSINEETLCGIANICKFYIVGWFTGQIYANNPKHTSIDTFASAALLESHELYGMSIGVKPLSNGFGGWTGVITKPSINTLFGNGTKTSHKYKWSLSTSSEVEIKQSIVSSDDLLPEIMELELKGVRLGQEAEFEEGILCGGRKNAISSKIADKETSIIICGTKNTCYRNATDYKRVDLCFFKSAKYYPEDDNNSGNHPASYFVNKVYVPVTGSKVAVALEISHFVDDLYFIHIYCQDEQHSSLQDIAKLDFDKYQYNVVITFELKNGTKPQVFELKVSQFAETTNCNDEDLVIDENIVNNSVKKPNVNAGMDIDDDDDDDDTDKSKDCDTDDEIMNVD